MYKKLLLATVAIFNVMAVPAQANTPIPTTAPASEPAGASSSSRCPVCPPCPLTANGGMGWVLIPAGPMNGAPCLQGNREESLAKAEEAIPAPVHGSHHHGIPENMPSVPEEEKLNEDLKKVKPQLFYRANPYGTTLASRTQQWGKVWENRVYFKENGRWVYDPTVRDEKDIVQGDFEGNRANINNFMAKNQPASSSPAINKNLGKSAETPGNPATPEAVTAFSNPETIRNGRRVLHTNKEGVRKWTRFITSNDKDQWYIFENNQWILWDEAAKGQALKTSSFPANNVPAPSVQPSLTARNIQTGPGTYNPKVPGAPDTPESNLNPVNRAAVQ